MDPEWRAKNLICAMTPDRAGITVEEQPMTPMRDDLVALFTRAELSKYLTTDELAALPEPAGHSEGSGS
jgi:succinate dehydrogenase / fumarate reductase flavoprotein subunit